ncbi:DUF3558 domain-containing protein [Streptomyces sp. VRA16 Mangrove soil]|uniref:DUF3558 domain-containing protein n=1 Tax=Streptomyces sp. VRA16 Mangrove soil TaxID=2817434 RepID=UPI001A9D2B9D|nr:DUF3558 domain-containing protein [Streptomyces sp. VRA16 Mangrove soil]MBO1337826.1 DUF3558 domain-containing protein [Streptomyces sp. VRA16 Mangrove soil]
MQRKSYAYVPGVAVLLTALLAGCSGSSDDGAGTDDSKPGSTSATASAAKPGKYRTLPEPCSQPGQDMLDEMLPGIAKITDQDQREKAYEGVATTTFDTARRVGCRWKDDTSAGGSHRLTLDFERVVSYDTSVSDDSKAEDVFASKADKAHLPEPVPQPPSPDASDSPESSGSSASVDSSESSGSSDASAAAGDAEGSGKKSGAQSGDGDASSSATASPSASGASADLRPRLLDGLGDEAFLNDVPAGPTSSRTRTVTVVFRTSNVVVTIEYEAQPATSGDVPDSKEMQDRAQELALKLVGKFSE